MSDSYSLVIKSSEKTAWVLDEILPENYSLDLTKQFIPIPLKAEVKEHGNFTKAELNLLSQTNAIAYTYIIEIIERYIVDLVMKQFPMPVDLEKERLRAMSRFLDEEVKHQQLFDRFNTTLSKNLNQRLETPNNGAEFARKVMEKSPLAIWLLTLHTEVMTHFHYTFLFKSGVDLEPKFVEILKAHWLEESQHVKVDSLEIQRLVKTTPETQLNLALKEYVELLHLIYKEQIACNFAAFENFKRISGVKINPIHEATLMSNIMQSARGLIIDAGLRHPTMVNTVKSFGVGFEVKLPEIAKHIEQVNSYKRAA